MSNTETPELDMLLEFIKDQRGYDFTGYKRPSLTRRMQKRMHALDAGSYREYHDILQAQPEEFNRLFDTILINVTSFFRDREAWDTVASAVIPGLLAHKDPDAPIRVWSPGCSTGEEAYTAIMLIAEAIGSEETRQRVKIYATDVDEDALRTARYATFTAEQMEPVPEHFQNRCFEQVNGNFVLQSDFRRSVIFGRHDLVRDMPISRIDLLICRNTMMYFNLETQRRILQQFHYALQPHGLMFLGRGEMMLTRSDLFTAVDLRHRIFAKVPTDTLEGPYRVPMGQHSGNLSPDGGSESAAKIDFYEKVLNTIPAAQLIVGADGRLTHANKSARTLFSLTTNDLGRPFQDLQASYRPVELRSLIEQAKFEGRRVTEENIRWELSHEEVWYYNISITPLFDDDGTMEATSLFFTDTTARRRAQDELERSRQETETAYEELESATEELETTNEELHSANEELETTNEELHSANEELETTNEELQASNEELDVINSELRERSTELAEANLFLESILNSMRLGMIVFDGDYRVEIWNTWATEFWGLRADEVEGEHFLSLDFGLPVDQLRDGIRQCLAGEAKFTKVNVESVNRLGRPIRCQVIIMPQFRVDERIDGVILLMEDISSSGEET